MIVLDTNVISEFMRARPDPAVSTWLRRLTTQPVTTAVNRAEVLVGITTLPPGRARTELRERADAAFEHLGHVLPLTSACAAHYAEIVAARKEAGRPIEGMDALIAAIARDAGLAVATRDVGGFSDTGVDVVNPWIRG